MKSHSLCNLTHLSVLLLVSPTFKIHRYISSHSDLTQLLYAIVFIITFIITYLAIYPSDFRYNSCLSCCISSNYSSSSATIRVVLWSGSACTVSYSTSCSQISTIRNTQTAREKIPRRCKTVHPVEPACRFWMIMIARPTTACPRMPQSTTKSTTVVTAMARTTVTSPIITLRRKNSLRTCGKLEHFFQCVSQPLDLSYL